MARIAHLILALVFALPCVRAAEPADTLTLRHVFTDLEAPAFDLLSRASRLDMVDYAEAGQPHKALNEMYGLSEVTSWSDSCISLDLTPVSRAQLFLLPAGKKGSLAALVYTVDAGGADSQISFYDSRLRQLSGKKYFTPPGLRDFISSQWRGDREVTRVVAETLPFMALGYVYEPSDRCLTVTLSISGIVSDEDYDRVRKYLVTDEAEGLPSLVYRWDGARFSLRRSEHRDSASRQ